MAKLKLTIHPIFFIFGLYFAITGKVFSFLIFTFTALLHEIGHSIASERLGYKLNRIVLMPYGAVIKGDIDGLSYPDEIKIAFAGPLINLCTALFFAALWWFVPQLYAYTELAVMASITIAAINFLPCYPLDGGRILLATLSIYISRKKAVKICKIIGIIASALLFALFVYSIFTTLNISVLFFSLFMLFGNIFVGEGNRYVKMYQTLNLSALKRGAKVTKLAVFETVKVKDLIKKLSFSELYELEIYSVEGKKISTLSTEKVLKILNSGKLYESISSLSRRELSFEKSCNPSAIRNDIKTPKR